MRNHKKKKGGIKQKSQSPKKLEMRLKKLKWGQMGDLKAAAYFFPKAAPPRLLKLYKE